MNNGGIEVSIKQKIKEMWSDDRKKIIRMKMEFMVSFPCALPFCFLPI